MSGVLAGTYAQTDVFRVKSNHYIPLDQWRTSPTVTVRGARSDPHNLETCNCVLTEKMVDLTDNDDNVWIKNHVYTLHKSDFKIITSMQSGWLSDKIITDSQLLLLQHFPSVRGQQSPILEQTNTFQVHTGVFAQILNVRGNHWVLVSNIG